MRTGAMRTLIRVRNANCPDCLNAIQDELLTRDRVHAVRIHAADGCLEVDHDHDRPDAIVGLLRRSLLGWQIADNGEVVQVAAVPELAHVCHVRHPGAQPSHDETRQLSELGGESPCFAHLLDEPDGGPPTQISATEPQTPPTSCELGD
jgi:hypothetical protein